jgi:hypothetical protein
MQNEIPHALASLSTKLMSKTGIIGRMRPGGMVAILFCTQFVMHENLLVLQHSAFLYPEEKFPE